MRPPDDRSRPAGQQGDSQDRGQEIQGYGNALPLYLAAGWPSVLPLPGGKKADPPGGYTGWKNADKWPTAEQHQRWAEQYPDGNIGLGLPADVLGLDVDNYGDKPGAETLAKLEAENGELPDTWTVSSRDDGISGIRLFRVPAGLAWSNQPGIDMLHIGHRYAVVWPSVHPNGNIYRWNRPGVPTLAELPELPPEWVGALSGGQVADEASVPPLAEALARRLLADWTVPGDPCPTVARALAKYPDPGMARHDTYCAVTLALVRLGERGHRGGIKAAAELRETFIYDVAPDRDGGQAEAEADRIVYSAVAKVAANPTPPHKRGCCDPADELEIAVQREMLKIRAREIARERLDIRLALERPEPKITPLVDLLAEPDDNRPDRVAGLWPKDGNVVLAAQRKAGKTTVVGNLVRCLADGDGFLGSADPFVSMDRPGFAVQQLADDERVLIADLELSRRTLRAWLRDQNIGNPDRIMAESFRGRLDLFDVLDEARRQAWADYLAEHRVRVLIVDPLAPLLAAYGYEENDNTGVARVLSALDALKAAGGVEELLVAHHMGHSGERSRGASRLRDWPDAEWRLVRESAAQGEEPPPDAARFLVAEGRDVAVPETKLDYDPATRRLSVAGGSRTQYKATKFEAPVLAVVKASPGLGVRDLQHAAEANDVPRDATRVALKALIRAGKVHTAKGARDKIRHFRTTSATPRPTVGPHGQKQAMTRPLSSACERAASVRECAAARSEVSVRCAAAYRPHTPHSSSPPRRVEEGRKGPSRRRAFIVQVRLAPHGLVDLHRPPDRPLSLAACGGGPRRLPVPAPPCCSRHAAPSCPQGQSRAVRGRT